MDESKFVAELARRLNLYLERHQQRASLTLTTPLAHSGYANVAHFLGELSMPSDLSKLSEEDAIFLVPNLEDNALLGFRVLSAKDLQKQQGPQST